MSEDVIHLFKAYTLDLAHGCLMQAGKPVHLRPQAYEVLKYLVENKGHLISKDRLIEAVWQGRAVTDSSLAKCIEEVREALGAEALQCVRNVRSRGYIFEPDIDEQAVGESLPMWSDQIESAKVDVIEDYRPLSKPQSTLLRGENRELSVSSARPVHFPRAFALVLILLLLLAGTVYLARRSSRPTQSPQTSRVILAVLPFENPGAGPEEEYFSSGLTEEMTTELANLQPERLGVIARASVMKFKQSGKEVGEIASELNVDYVLESSVHRNNGRLRINARLIQVRDQTHVWAHSYERELHDVLAIQNEVARAIAREIALQLSPNQQRRLSTSRQINPEAHEAYLKGLFFFDKFTESGMQKSIDYFQLAVNKEPGYAPPYARMARAYGLLGNFNTLRPEQAYPRQREAALRALELDGTLAEAHSALGWTRLFYDRDWEGARTEFQRAVELSPDSPTAHQGYAIYFVSMGQFDRAMEEIRRAEQLDPVSLIIKADVGWCLFYARRTDESITQLKQVLEMDQNFSIVRVFLAYSYQQKGMFTEAVWESQQAVKLFEGNEHRIALLGHAYALSGRKREARQVLERLKAVSHDRYISPYTTALIYASLGEFNEAFNWLGQAYRDRFWMMAFLNVDPRWDSLRSDPRFVDLLRRMDFVSIPNSATKSAAD